MATNPEITRLQARVTELLNYNNAEVERRRVMARAARDLYFAGRWSCDRPVDEVKLWEALRDAAEIPSGSATAAGVHQPKPKILVLGWARHGKDTVAEILRDQHGFQFQSSSMFCAETVCRPAMAELGITYDNLDDCYADRVNHRATWYEAIKAYNADDAARLAKGILATGDLYVGMRSAYEFSEARKLFDHIWWVDASGRGLPPEPRNSMDIDREPGFTLIRNDGNLSELKWAVAAAVHDLQAQPAELYGDMA